MDSYSADAIRGSSTLAYLPVNFLSADSQDTITSIDTDRTSGDRSMLGRDPSDICGDSSHNAALDTAGSFFFFSFFSVTLDLLPAHFTVLYYLLLFMIMVIINYYHYY